MLYSGGEKKLLCTDQWNDVLCAYYPQWQRKHFIRNIMLVCMQYP